MEQAGKSLVHGTCIAIGARAVVLRGPSGAGKSDLALRLIDRGARLVADDYVKAEVRDGALWATAPDTTRGLLEVRGVGVVSVPVTTAPVVLLIDLVPPDLVERLPEARTETLLGVSIPVYALAAFEASADAKVRALLKDLSRRGYPGVVERNS